MSIKNEALRLIGELPDDCTWLDVMHAAAARAGGRLVAVAESPEELGRCAVRPAREPAWTSAGGAWGRSPSTCRRLRRRWRRWWCACATRWSAPSAPSASTRPRYSRTRAR